nr:Vht1.1 [Starmerella bombicola]
MLHKKPTVISSSGSQNRGSEAASIATRISRSSSEIKPTFESTASQAALKRLYRKLDFRIIPALWMLHFLNCYGGAIFGNALTMNSDKGHDLPHYLHLSSHDITLSIALDYVAYIVFDLPMNLCFTIIPPKVWLSRIIITIGCAYACIAAVRNAAGLKAVRFFTGVASAGIWPGLSYYVSCFYPGDRLSTRIGYYFTAAQISGVAAGLLAACFQLMDGSHGYTGYQWNFIIYGATAITVGFGLYFWLPNRPEGQAIWPLTEEELELHQKHLKFCGMGDNKWTWKKFVEVLRDPRVWPCVFMYFGVIGCGSGINNYATTIILNMSPNISPVKLSLLTAPIWLFALGGSFLVAPLADKFKHNRALIFSLSTSVIICGMFACTFAPTVWSRWSGLLICGFGLGAVIPINMAWGIDIFKKRHGDLGVAIASALISGLGNFGSVTSSYALYRGWPEDASRGYRASNLATIALLIVSIVAATSNTLLRYGLGDFGEKTLVEVTFLRWFRRKSALPK